MYIHHVYSPFGIPNTCTICGCCQPLPQFVGVCSVMSQISTVVSSTFGTVICPIRRFYSRLVISDRCKARKYPNRVLSKSCRPLAGAGGQWAELGRKLRQTCLLTPFSAKIIWLYDSGSSESFAPCATLLGLTTLVLAHPSFSTDRLDL